MLPTFDLEGLTEKERERLLFAVAESVLEMSESQALGEVRQSGEDPTEVARRTRLLLWSQAKVSRKKPLFDALREYQIQVERMRARKTNLPETPQARRDLMLSLFHRYPQMQSAFMTVQHREFKSWSDSDIESFLRQLQELGAIDAEEAKLPEPGGANGESES